MGSRALSSRKLTETLMLSECKPTAENRGRFWLWDETQGMNLAMGAETEEEALVEALMYYQKYLAQYRNSYTNLRSQVDLFVESVSVEEE